MAGLRIGVNALYLIPGHVGGTEIYLRGLLGALARADSVNHYFVMTNQETGPDLTPVASNFHWRRTEVRASNRAGRILWEQALLPLEARGLGIDVLFNPGFTAPALAPCPMVTVFHDLQHKRQPENFRWFDLPFWNLLLWTAAHRSDQLLADSENTRRDLLHYYRIPPEKVTVAPLGADPEFFEIALRRNPQPYLLAASTLHPHKNLDALLRAFAVFRAKHQRFRLVVTGLRGFFARELETLREELGLGQSVEFTGWIPRGQLHELFAGAHAFCYPSRFEGFGLPVVEALAAAVPTACSRIPSLEAIAGEAALLFDPNDPAALEAALERISFDETLRERLAREGPLRARRFSWERTARLTLEVIERAGRGG